MKKFFSITFFLLLFCTGHAQIKTSLEDFIYVTVALHDDLKTGRGVKHGYSIEDIGGESVTVPGGGVMKIATTYLKKGDEKVAIVVAIVNTANGNSKMWCIPAAASEKTVWDRADQTFQTSSLVWGTALITALAKTISLKLL